LCHVFDFRTIWYDKSRPYHNIKHYALRITHYLMTMLSAFVTFPAEFVALTVKFDVAAIVGVPVIAPVDAFKFKPVGSVPLTISHVIGVVPVAASLWL